MRAPGKKSGNNTLIFIAGGLGLVLILLILLGSSRQSTIDQLLASAAPDSSAYKSDSSQMDLTSGQPETEKEVEVPVKPIVQQKDSIAVQPDKGQSEDSISKPVSVPSAPLVVSEVGGEMTILYKIRKGDTMYKIAAKFGNKPADILALNGLADMSVQADKEIKVKIKAMHSVGEGEGLLSVSEKYGVPPKSIKVANGLTSEIIPSGSKLIIPLK